MTNEKANAITGILQNEAIRENLMDCASVEDVLGILRESGVDASEQDLEELLMAVPTGANGELSEEALEDVSGGASFMARLRKVLRMVSTVPLLTPSKFKFY
ncbi:MAG: hypothetical protein J6P72_09660 [Firmicutes bacterium]|nr:hypothetical protein [Bacillota bacterium]